jgi:hypothetical protein
MLVYLSGGIQGQGYDEANEWREDATKKLAKCGHHVLNPLRNRLWKEAQEQEQFSINELAHRDFLDVEKCDVLLVEMTDPNRNYVGTTAEITLARELYRKPVVAFVGTERMGSNNGMHYSYWLDYLCTKVVATMDEAIDYICKVLDYDGCIA